MGLLPLVIALLSVSVMALVGLIASRYIIEKRQQAQRRVAPNYTDNHNHEEVGEEEGAGIYSMSEVEDRSGEVNAAVVLRRRLSELPTPTRCRNRHNRRPCAGGGYDSSTSSDIDPVALRQETKMTEKELEELMMLDELAVVGVVMREEDDSNEVGAGAVRPRGGVIYRVPRSAVTPTSREVSREFSHASLHTTEVNNGAAGVNDGDLRALSPLSRRRKVRNDSLVMYGRAIYTDKAGRHTPVDEAAVENSTAAVGMFVASEVTVEGSTKDNGGDVLLMVGTINEKPNYHAVNDTLRTSENASVTIPPHVSPHNLHSLHMATTCNSSNDFAHGTSWRMFGCSSVDMNPTLSASGSTAAPTAHSIHFVPAMTPSADAPSLAPVISPPPHSIPMAASLPWPASCSSTVRDEGDPLSVENIHLMTSVQT